MKSLYTKILGWSIATVLFSLVGFYQITGFVSRNAQRRGGSFGHLREMQLEGFKVISAGRGAAVLYKGPFRQVTDDAGTVYPRGRRVAADAAAIERLASAEGAELVALPGAPLP